MDAGLSIMNIRYGAGIIPIEYGEQGLFDLLKTRHRRSSITDGLLGRPRRLGWRSMQKDNIGNGPANFAMVALQCSSCWGQHFAPRCACGSWWLHQAGAVILLGSVIWLSHGLTRTR